MFVETTRIDGAEVYRVRFVEAGNVETKVLMTAGDLLPVSVERAVNGERIYTVQYSGVHADVFIPKERVRESQEAIPFVFRKLFGLLATDTTVELDPPGDPNPAGAEETPGPMPSRSLMQRALAYQEEAGMIPAADGDTHRRFLLPPETLAVQSLPLVLGGFPFGRTREIHFPLAYLPHPMVVWKMKATHAGEEEVHVPAGTIESYKIRMQTAEWFSRFAFGDKTYFWIRKEPPHILVKHVHPFARESSELVRYETGDDRD